MRVVCENCGATYKIPDTKLVKAVNKATCRKCGFKMMIQRPRPPGSRSGATHDPAEAATVVKESPVHTDAELLEAKTLIGTAAEQQEWSDEAPTQVRVPDQPARPPSVSLSEKAVPRPDVTAPISAVATIPASKDMVLAMVGTFSAAGGALLLAVTTTASPSLRFIGLAVALWGSLTTLFLLVTGNLGRQKGNIAMSMALGTVLAITLTGVIQLTFSGPPTPVSTTPPPAEAPITPTETVVDLATEALKAADDIAEAAQDTVQEIVEDGEEVVTDAAEEIAEQIVVPAPTPEIDQQEQEARRAAEQARQEEKAQRRAEAATARAAAARAAAARAATPAPPKLKSVPLSVVDTVIRTNLSIKRCFFQEKQRAGQLPRRVTVRFTVLPSGRISTARVGTAEFQGGPLDECLGRAFRGIQFPPFDGEPLSMTYPFVL
jgi:DNA-directed RNA polymerase subunit RPC12/RpoP